MWDLIVSVPDHCLSFYFPLSEIKLALHDFSGIFKQSDGLLENRDPQIKAFMMDHETFCNSDQ